MKMSVRIKILAVFITGCLVIAPSMAFAGPEEAAQFYEQASQAYGAEEYAKAADLLERAYAEDPNLIYQYNRVLALQAMGKFDRALKALDIYGNPMKEDGRFDDIKDIRAQLVEAKADAKAAAEKADQAKVTANGTDSENTSGDNKDSQDTDNDITMTEPADSGPNILGWSLVGVGTAGLGAAGLFGSGVLISDVVDRRDCMSQEGTALSACYSGDDLAAQNQSDRDTLSTHQTLTWVSLGVGVAALVGGGVVFLMDQPQPTETVTPLSADNADVRVTPYVGADGAGGVLTVSF
jgi:tetratricopeptide (TPR) repeat protein